MVKKKKNDKDYIDKYTMIKGQKGKELSRLSDVGRERVSIGCAGK
jgi:hypothetical protein